MIRPFAIATLLQGGDGDVIMGLGFDLRLTGPNNYVIDGRVWATVFGIDVGFGVRHEWGDRRDLPDAIADPVGILRDAIAAAPILESVRATTLSDGVRFVQPRPGEESLKASSPVGALRFSQRALPLAVAIEKIGEASIVGGASTFDLAAFVGNDPVTLNPSDLEFVRGHFWKMSEADRLRTPAFERHKSGFVIASDALRADMARSIDVEYGYEFIHIGDDAIADASPLFPFATVSNAPVTRWMEAHHRAHSSPLDPVAVVSQPPDAPVVKEVVYAAVDTPDIAARPFSVADRIRSQGVTMKRNTVVADWLIKARAPQ